MSITNINSGASGIRLYQNDKTATANRKAPQEQLVQAKSGEDTTESLISRKERDYFKKLFPENSTQIERHEVFTRNGKLSATNVSKGTIVDWTV